MNVVVRLWLGALLLIVSFGYALGDDFEYVLPLGDAFTPQDLEYNTVAGPDDAPSSFAVDTTFGRLTGQATYIPGEYLDQVDLVLDAGGASSLISIHGLGYDENSGVLALVVDLGSMGQASFLATESGLDVVSSSVDCEAFEGSVFLAVLQELDWQFAKATIVHKQNKKKLPNAGLMVETHILLAGKGISEMCESHPLGFCTSWNQSYENCNTCCDITHAGIGGGLSTLCGGLAAIACSPGAPAMAACGAGGYAGCSVVVAMSASMCTASCQHHPPGGSQCGVWMGMCHATGLCPTGTYGLGNAGCPDYGACCVADGSDPDGDGETSCDCATNPCFWGTGACCPGVPPPWCG